jgi:hypothetical protein
VLVVPGLPGVARGRAAAALGGDDPFREDLRTIVLAVAAIPERNYLVALVAGLVIALTAVAFTLLLRYLPLASDGYDEDGYDDVARRRAEFLRCKCGSSGVPEPHWGTVRATGR